MRSLIVLTLALASLSGCDRRPSQAQEIVKNELGNPAYAEFRRVRVAKGKLDIVCGEVDASDKPGTGWRYFVAYVSLKRAAVAPPGEITAAAEMGNPLLQGEAGRFLHACD